MVLSQNRHDHCSDIVHCNIPLSFLIPKNLVKINASIIYIAYKWKNGTGHYKDLLFFLMLEEIKSNFVANQRTNHGNNQMLV